MIGADGIFPEQLCPDQGANERIAGDERGPDWRGIEIRFGGKPLLKSEAILMCQHAQAPREQIAGRRRRNRRVETLVALIGDLAIVLPQQGRHGPQARFETIEIFKEIINLPKVPVIGVQRITVLLHDFPVLTLFFFGFQESIFTDDLIAGHLLSPCSLTWNDPDPPIGTATRTDINRIQKL